MRQIEQRPTGLLEKAFGPAAPITVKSHTVQMRDQGKTDRSEWIPVAKRSAEHWFYMSPFPHRMHLRQLRKWCRRRDLNPRPTHYECVALPLSYAGPRMKNGRKLGLRRSLGKVTSESRAVLRVPPRGCDGRACRALAKACRVHYCWTGNRPFASNGRSIPTVNFLRRESPPPSRFARVNYFPPVLSYLEPFTDASVMGSAAASPDA